MTTHPLSRECNDVALLRDVPAVILDYFRSELNIDMRVHPEIRFDRGIPDPAIVVLSDPPTILLNANRRFTVATVVALVAHELFHVYVHTHKLKLEHYAEEVMADLAAAAVMRKSHSDLKEHLNAGRGHPDVDAVNTAGVHRLYAAVPNIRSGGGRAQIQRNFDAVPPRVAHALSLEFNRPLFITLCSNEGVR